MAPGTLILVKVLVFLVAASACLLAAYELAGERGFVGAAAGAGAAAALCALSHWLLSWERRGTGRGMYVAAFGSAAASLVGIALTALVVWHWKRDLVGPAILTVLFIYLAARAVDVVQAAFGARAAKGASARTECRT